LIAARKKADVAPEIGAGNAEPAAVLGRQVPAGTGPQHASAGALLQAGASEIVGHTLLEKEAQLFAVLRHIGETRVNCIAERTELLRTAFKENAARIGAVSLKNGAHQLRAARSDQAAEPEDFLAPNGKVDVVKMAAVIEIFDTEQLLLDLRRPGGIQLRKIPANDGAQDLVARNVGGPPTGHDLAVPQCGDPVADAEDFVHAMGNKDNSRRTRLEF